MWKQEKPKLTNAQKEKRLAFAESASQDPKYWKKVLFADEKYFKLSFGQKKAWIEEKDEPPILQTVKFPTKIMVWGGISAQGKTQLIKIPAGIRMKASDYVEMIASHIPEEGKSVFGGSNWKLLEDGAPSSRSSNSKLLPHPWDQGSSQVSTQFTGSQHYWERVETRGRQSHFSKTNYCWWAVACVARRMGQSEFGNSQKDGPELSISSQCSYWL